jgi:hypothetical protein
VKAQNDYLSQVCTPVRYTPRNMSKLDNDRAVHLAGRLGYVAITSHASSLCREISWPRRYSRTTRTKCLLERGTHLLLAGKIVMPVQNAASRKRRCTRRPPHAECLVELLHEPFTRRIESGKSTFK